LTFIPHCDIIRFVKSIDAHKHRKDVAVIKKNTLLRHILPIIAAIAFIPLIFAGSSLNFSDSERFSRKNVHTAITCGGFRLAVISAPEELLPSNTARIVRWDNSRKNNQPKSFGLCSKESSLLLFLAVLFYTAVLLRRKKLFISNRYIIKYIHDKDGLKITSPY